MRNGCVFIFLVCFRIVLCLLSVWCFVMLVNCLLKCSAICLCVVIVFVLNVIVLFLLLVVCLLFNDFIIFQYVF